MSDKPTVDELDRARLEVIDLLIPMAVKRYEQLFPWARVPAFDPFMAWLDELGVTFSEFAFHIRDPDTLALRLAEVGPVGGWQVQDENDPAKARNPPLGEIEQIKAKIQASIDAAKPSKRKRKSVSQT
jgi:hypothetical protein